MRNRIFLVTIFIVWGYTFAVAQNPSPIVLDDFVGNWKVDMEKSFSRSERRKMTDYTVIISGSDGTLEVLWEFMNDGTRTQMNDEYKVDGKEHSLKDKYLFNDVRAYTGQLKGNKIKIRFHQSFERNTSVYLDERTLELSSDKKTLTIETVRRSAKRGDAANSETKRLVLLRQN